jgi:hypothetical protein
MKLVRRTNHVTAGIGMVDSGSGMRTGAYVWCRKLQSTWSGCRGLGWRWRAVVVADSDTRDGVDRLT